MGPGGMSPEADALTRGVTEGVPLPALLLPHPGHVISQSLNRPACEMGMTIAVTQASRPTTVRPTATAPGVRHCTRGCPHTDLCHPHLCPVGNCPQDAGSLASLWEAAPGHPQPTHRRHGRQPHGSGARQAPRQHTEAPCPRLPVSRARLDSWDPSGPPFPRRDAGGETPLAASGRDPTCPSASHPSGRHRHSALAVPPRPWGPHAFLHSHRKARPVGSSTAEFDQGGPLNPYPISRWHK